MKSHNAVAAPFESVSRSRGNSEAARVAPTRRLTISECAILAVAILAVATVSLYPGIRSRGTDWSSTVTIKVNEAQTLWGIAKSHPVEGQTTAETVAAIRSNNELTQSDLRPGQLLKVPGEAGSSTAMASR